jgi:hypothetical protein
MGNYWGSYSGSPKTEWLPDGRRMRLLERITFSDAIQNRDWVAPQDWIVDGASIPRLFWSVIGGPLEGPYRNASVFHDVAGDQKWEPWKMVHRMFYNAMRCSDVNSLQAKIMYYAVYHFGPRWGPPHWFRWLFSIRARKGTLRKHLTDDDVQRVVSWVYALDPEIDVIEAHDAIVEAVAARCPEPLLARLVTKVAKLLEYFRIPPVKGPPTATVGKEPR